MLKKLESLVATILLTISAGTAGAEKLPLVDAHIHYSEDAWQVLSAERAVELLRAAGLKKALVSSSGDEGTRRLYRAAPELVVPVLRPYRKRGETSRWIHDESLKPMLAELLSKNDYAGLGEFHADGAQMDLPVPRYLVELAGRHGIFLHAHVDVDALRRIFEIDPGALVLWAHAGFESTEVVGEAMAKYPNLWADLSFREEIAFDGDLEDEWRKLFERFPDRFMLGTDTYTPQRWFYVVGHADRARAWLAGLPDEIAHNIAWRNAETLLSRTGWE